MFECVINISEGRDAARLAAFAVAAGTSLRDVHSDPDHHRSVFTLIHDRPELRDDVRRFITSVFEGLTLESHEGVHPRFGVVDVVPFVALDAQRHEHALELRNETAEWISADFDVPTFLYGDQPELPRTLPAVRRGAFKELSPDFGPATSSPTWGATAVGARPPLVAWNMWLEHSDLATASSIARELRDDIVRTRSFRVQGSFQVSCNIVDVHRARLSEILDRVRELLPEQATVARCELVGLAPRVLLEKEDPRRWSELGLSPGATIESHLGH